MNFGQMIQLMEGWASSSVHYENRDEIENMLSNGMTVEDIARKLEMSEDEIYGIMDEMGWEEG